MTIEEKKEKQKRIQVQADECMKMLFSLSDQPTLDLLNGLFGEQFSVADSIVIRGNTEFVGKDMSVTFADSLFYILQGDEQKEYHVEFQTFDDHSMIIRMFEYGYQIAKQKTHRDKNQLVMKFPHQLVLYLERDDSILENLSCVIEFPPYKEANRFVYEVPVTKFWNIEPEMFQDQLYALIPFHVFASRKQIRDILKDTEITQEQQRLLVHEELAKVIQIIKTTQEALLKVRDAGKMDNDDLDKMGTVIINLSDYLYRRFYPYFESFYEEVKTVVTNVLNKKALELNLHRGKIEQQSDFIIECLREVGHIENTLKDRIKKESDLNKLMKWGKLAARSQTIEDFVTQLDS